MSEENNTTTPKLVFGEEPADTAAPSAVKPEGTDASADIFGQAPSAPAQNFSAAAGTLTGSAGASGAGAADFATAASPAPSLQFGQTPAAGAAAAAKVGQTPSTQDALAAVTDQSLTEEEKKQVDEFSKRIDVTDSAAILSYGAGAQKKMSEFSEKALENVRTKDMGEVGDMIASLVTELNSFDAGDSGSKGFLGLFKKNTDKLETMKAKYDKAEVNVDKISQALEDHQTKLIKDIAVLDQMYDLNLQYFKELTMYILAGKKRLKEIREGELAQLIAKAEKSGLAEDAQAAKDLDEKCERFEKKLYDLELTRAVALQTAPQIRLVQDSDEIMVEKIQSTLVNTIPLWKNQMVIALGVQHSNEAAKAQQAVTNLTNDLLKKNAQTLKSATIETAQQAERGIVDIETLRETNASLISTLDEVVKIQEDGRAKREAAEAEMRQMEASLKDKLVEMSKN